jgi:hypothetical protein
LHFIVFVLYGGVLMTAMTQTEIAAGPPIPPAARVQLMDDKAFEILVHAWMAGLTKKYKGVDRFGGPGDMGRDVVGWTTDKKCLGPWDNVQCKRLADPLAPSQLWLELGKIFWHVAQGDYILPRQMKFLCSKGIGTRAKHFLTNPDKLKAELIKHWPTHVAEEITTTGTVALTSDLKSLVESTSFDIFGPMAIEDVLKDLEGTAYYVEQFGGGLPTRPAVPAPPMDPLAHESRYVTQLFGVYAERRGGGPVDLGNLDQEARDRRHFDMCRQQFYCAESLKEFARDATRPGTFEGFQDDVLSTITPILYEEHETTFDLVNATLRTAALIPPAANALYSVVNTRDKQGVCHQLVNDNRIDWVGE